MFKRTSDKKFAKSPSARMVDPAIVKKIEQMPKAKYNELKSMFKTFDKNGDGVVSVSELQIALGKMEHKEVTKQEAEEMIKSADLNKDGYMDFAEFLAMVLRREAEADGAKQDMQAELRAMFKALDKNQDGKISKSELQVGMKEMGIEYSDAELDSMIASADINKDGQLDFDEFAKLFNDVCPSNSGC